MKISVEVVSKPFENHLLSFSVYLVYFWIIKVHEMNKGNLRLNSAVAAAAVESLNKTHFLPISADTHTLLQLFWLWLIVIVPVNSSPFTRWGDSNDHHYSVKWAETCAACHLWYASTWPDRKDSLWPSLPASAARHPLNLQVFDCLIFPKL